MESFVKVRSREQKKKEHTDWRNDWFKKMRAIHGIYRAEFLAVACKISFDVQPESSEALVLASTFKKKHRIIPFVIISVN